MAHIRFPVSIHAAITPNPNVIKFIADRYLLVSPTISVEFKNIESARGSSSLAEELFSNFDFVTGVFIAKNFISVTKKSTEMAWDYLNNEVRHFIWDFITSGKPILSQIPEEKSSLKEENEKNVSSPFDQKIKDLMKQFIQKPVQEDGGEIVFRQFKDGIVTVLLKGACRGCPARNKTLKSGIETILKRHIPEVEEVVAENEEELSDNLQVGIEITSPFSLDFSAFDESPEIGKS